MKLIIFVTTLLVSACATNNKSLQHGSAKISLTGVWKVEQFAFRYPDSVWSVRTPPYESLFIFAKGHYSSDLTLLVSQNPKPSSDLTFNRSDKTISILL